MKVSHFIPAMGWFLLSLVLLCLPGSTLPEYPFLARIYADKWVHIILFGTLCFLFSRPFAKSSLDRNRRRKGFLFITVTGIMYGTLMEFVQEYWIVNRSFEVLDIAADSTGCLLALGISLKQLGGGIKKIGPDGNRDRNQN